MPTPYIFISHSSKDNPAVMEIAEDLEAQHIALWVDFDCLVVGDEWLAKIEDAIDGCAGVLVVISGNSRRADWVMRECLYALQVRKPLYIARIDPVPLPLLLVDRQYTDLVDDYDSGMVHLQNVLRHVLDNPLTTDDPKPLPEGISQYPNEHNFFTYLGQMDEGDDLATVARDLYTWSKIYLSDTSFSGRFRPAMHARYTMGEKEVTVFSLLAYLRHPAVQIPFDYLRKYPPFTRRGERVRMLKRLETLLPPEDGFDPERADRRPTIALSYLLGSADRLETFKDTVLTIVRSLEADG